jgi:hypothetical protein
MKTDPLQNEKPPSSSSGEMGFKIMMPVFTVAPRQRLRDGFAFSATREADPVDRVESKMSILRTTCFLHIEIPMLSKKCGLGLR